LFLLGKTSGSGRAKNENVTVSGTAARGIQSTNQSNFVFVVKGKTVKTHYICDSFKDCLEKEFIFANPPFSLSEIPQRKWLLFFLFVS
jgi:hypothetical protein